MVVSISLALAAVPTPKSALPLLRRVQEQGIQDAGFVDVVRRRRQQVAGLLRVGHAFLIQYGEESIDAAQRVAQRGVG